MPLMLVNMSLRIGTYTSAAFLFALVKYLPDLPPFLITVVDDVECENDAGCGPDLACLQGKCKNPCDATSCGIRAVCRVANTLPFRTLVCECPKPLTGDASVQCNPSKYTCHYLY